MTHYSKTWIETGTSPLAQFFGELKKNKVSDEDILQDKLNGNRKSNVGVGDSEKEEDEDEAGYVPTSEFRKDFKVCVSYSWRKRYLLLTVAPMLLIFICKCALMHESVLVYEYKLFGVLPSRFSLSAVLVLLIAILTDAAAILQVSKDTICLLVLICVYQ